MPTPRAEPFEIHVPDDALDDLRDRLLRWRATPDFDNDDWRYGTNGDYLSELVGYWIDEYDWRTHEAAMNAFSNYRVEIDGMPIHFLHEAGRGPTPLPLVLSHGWPWTFWDFEQVIGPLADPGAHGGDPADAFDVIVPSLPGFGFSSPLNRSGVGITTTAVLWDELMRGVLGYEHYGAQGGDWGAIVSATLGHRFADAVVGVHESLPGFLGLDYASLAPEDYGPDEADWPARMAAKMATATSHMAVHSMDPQTLAYALDDSPVGLAAWIVERRRAWGDCGGDVESRFSKDHLLTTVSVYWHTRTIGTSMRYYFENAHGEQFAPVHDRQPAVEVPSGFAVFPEDVLLVPRKVAERHANVQRWTVMEAGGHFAPAEEPECLVEDVRAFFRTLRST